MEPKQYLVFEKNIENFTRGKHYLVIKDRVQGDFILNNAGTRQYIDELPNGIFSNAAHICEYEDTSTDVIEDTFKKFDDDKEKVDCSMEPKQYLICKQNTEQFTEGSEYLVSSINSMTVPHIIDNFGNLHYIDELPDEVFSDDDISVLMEYAMTTDTARIIVPVEDTFKKFDDDKAIMSFPLGMRAALESVAKVMKFGAAKYGKDNWRLAKGEDVERYKEAALRHLVADCSGELVDQDSGNLHIEHALTSLMMYIELRGTND